MFVHQIIMASLKILKKKLKTPKVKNFNIIRDFDVKNLLRYLR